MFKPSTNSQGDLFRDIASLLPARKQKLYDSANGWHNVFNREIISRIDERPYAVLYSEKMGRPNAPVRILIGMMILKEGNGWSDEQLFEECRFNLKVMRALGLHSIGEDVPAESTYYEFRKLLGEYNETYEEDLLKDTFSDITTQQVSAHGVSSKKIRLDSKLINSNIAKSNRLQMIVEATRKYVRGIKIEHLVYHLDSNLYELLESLQHKSASNITYPLNAKEKKEMLVIMGGLIRTLLEHSIGSNAEYRHLLERIYKEQYEEVKADDDSSNHKDESNAPLAEEKEDIVIAPKNPKDIGSSSVQSVHDPEAAYRTKGQGASKQTVSGYHSNITESCDPEDSVNLILDIEVVAANVCEDAFLIDSVDTCQEIIKEAHDGTKSIEEVITDGGYDSVKNRSQMLEEEYPTWSIAKMKGGRRIYQMSYNERGDLEVYDCKSGVRCDVHFSQRAQKYVIQLEGGTKRYMTKKQVGNYIKRQQIEDQVNEESYNLRASVESTIHQTFHRLKKNNKMVYRGLAKCQWYVLSRAFWVNMVRIMDQNLKKALFLYFLTTERFVRALILNRASKNIYHPKNFDFNASF